MRPSKSLALALAALAAGTLLAEPALAHGRGGARVTFGIHVGVPAYGYGHGHWRPHHYYRPAPVYYWPAPVVYSAPVVVHSAPPVYVERQDMAPAQPAPPPQSFWYYCADSRTYYPYVKECPGGWQRVNPTPQG